jgi:hypothetical protein
MRIAWRTHGECDGIRLPLGDRGRKGPSSLLSESLLVLELPAVAARACDQTARSQGRQQLVNAARTLLERWLNDVWTLFESSSPCSTTRPPNRRRPGIRDPEHGLGRGLGVDVKIILTPPCILCMENH